MQLFYVPNFSLDEPYLTPEESHHAVKVLRLKAGAELHLTDGAGNLYTTEIAEPHFKKTRLFVNQVAKPQTPRPVYVHLVVAPTKSPERMEWFVEKAIEIGIEEISFVLCEHSEKKQLNFERIQRVAVSAMKQSLKLFMPRLNPLMTFADFMHKPFVQSQRFIAYLPEKAPPMLASRVKPMQSYCLLIGPEGDFSSKEVNWAMANEFQPVSLGQSRLRTETAALIGVHTFNLLNGM